MMAPSGPPVLPARSLELIPASIADELLLKVPFNRDTSWSSGGLGMDSVAFNAVVQCVLEVESHGALDVIELGRETYSSAARFTAITFIRVA